MTSGSVSPRFIQIHFLSAWPGTLLNRDDAGLAKRLPFGSAVRTRVSSQCLKRHWRMADDPRALRRLASDEGVASLRSRLAIERLVIDPLRESYPEETLQMVHDAFVTKFYGKNARDPKQRPALLLGEPELAWMREIAEKILKNSADRTIVEKRIADFLKEEKANLSALGKGAALAAGLEAAVFGRMVTSDVKANTDAAIHVAHAFTVHAEQSELDYFTVVDDLQNREDDGVAGAAGVFDSELTSGLYYGYAVIDVPLLVRNITGCAIADWAGDHDRTLAARAVESLVWLIAEISPGAKRGSTAPYSRAELVLVEAGSRQPRSLANAFREPVSLSANHSDSLSRRTADRLASHLAELDEVYATGEVRRHMALPDLALPGVERMPLAALAQWAGALVQAARA